MDRNNIETVGSLVRSVGFIDEYPVIPAITRATVLVTDAKALITAYNAAGASQVGGLGDFRGGSTERKFLRNEIYTVLSEMSDVAKGLDPVEHPGVADRFRLSESRRNYQGLIDTGAAFVEAVEDPAVKALFTDRGFEADFDTKLTDKLAAFADATDRKFDGLRHRKTGTAGLKVLKKKSTKLMKELRAIMEKHLRKNAPALLEVWEAASRVYRGSPAEDGAPTGGSPTAPTTPTTPTTPTAP